MEQWIEELKDFESNPELIIEKSAEELAAMDADTYAQYEQQHQKQRDIEEKAAKIRDSMVTMANEKMSTINAAVKAANKKLGLTNEIFFDGYTWNQTTQKMWVPEDMESEVSKWFGGFAYTFLDLSLEGNGVIRKQNASEYTNKLIRAELEQPTLTFDYGEVYMMETNDYRQYVNLQAFFAWCELRMGQELAPSLLDGIVEMYDFNEHEREQLRQMLMNKESVDFILDTLRMDPDEGFALIRFVNAVEEGPTYSHFHGPSRESESYTLGVEFSQQGELILKYIHQANPYSMNMGWDEEARFTPTDVQLMQSVAYGPLLSA